jgi:hypothetical protein
MKCSEAIAYLQAIIDEDGREVGWVGEAFGEPHGVFLEG